MFEMYRAVYSFKSGDSNALDFSENDLFTVIDQNRDQHWWLVQNGKGQVGFVPANYLKKNEASHADVVQSIDRAIEVIRESAPLGNLENLTQLQKANLQKLEKHKERVIEEHRREKSRDIKLQPQRKAPATPGTGARNSSKRSSVPPPLPVRHSVLSSPTSPDLGQSAPFVQNGTSKAGPHSDSHHISRGETSQTAENVIHAPNAETESQVGRDIRNESAANSNYCTSGEQTLVSEVTSFCKQCQHAIGTNPSTNFNNVKPGKDIGRKLVEAVRSTSQLSYGKSQQAVDVVLSCLMGDVPQIAPVIESVLVSLHKQDVDTSHVDLTSEDAVRLQEIFNELAKCKDDSQQRSWFLHEDEHVISGHLEELLSVLDGAHADVSKAIVRQEDFSALNNLVLYYQMETRTSLRTLLLQVFGSLCTLDGAFIAELLNSVLPLELARDMQTDVSDIQKLSYSCLVLTMIFSMGESVPLQYYTHLNEAFIHSLFNMVEDPPDSDTSHQMPELVVNLILAYNLHFELPSENTVMRVLADKGTSKLFTERLLFLVNRGDDPVRMFEHEPKPPSSVLKFLADLYSSRETSGVVYTNDAMVLIDIIVGRITDLSPSDKVRTEYLSLMELIIKNTDYAEHCHRKSDLELCFKRISGEEEETANDMDKVIVQQIWRQFPDLFDRGGF